jgi:hypothetical protein
MPDTRLTARLGTLLPGQRFRYRGKEYQCTDMPSQLITDDGRDAIIEASGELVRLGHRLEVELIHDKAGR